MADAAPKAESQPAGEAAGVVPEFEELKTLVRTIKLANPDLGIAKVHAAVKEQQPTWQVSQDRVKKILSEMVIMSDGKLVKGALNHSGQPLSSKEIAKKKTEAALAKKKEEAKAKKSSGAVAAGVD